MSQSIEDEVIAEMSEVAFAQWRHHPVTKAFMKFLGDQAAADREAVADLWAQGALQDPPPHLNPDMLRGRYVALLEVRDLKLTQMREFYGLEEQDSDQSEKGK